MCDPNRAAYRFFPADLSTVFVHKRVDILRSNDASD
jgi:hypothetical protein